MFNRSGGSREEIALIGADKFFWASDHSHPDHPANYLEELQAMVTPMSETTRHGILGEDVTRTYQLD